MVTETVVKTLLRCQNVLCRKVMMGITGVVEAETGIGIRSRCPRCGCDNEWVVRVID